MQYGSQTRRSLETHSFSGKSLHQYRTFIQAICLVKAAAAHANTRCGQLSTETSQRIQLACETVANTSEATAFPVDVFQGGGSIAIHWNLIELIADQAQTSPQEVNHSQSTADVCATAMRIALNQVGTGLLGELRASTEILHKKATEFAAVETLARTCLQDASPVALGATFSAYAAVLARRELELAHSLDSLRQINLGGTVFGSGIGAPPLFADHAIAYLRAHLPIPLERRENLYDAAQNADDLGQVSSQLALLAEMWIKIGKDLRLLGSGPQGGFGEIRIPGVMAGSSFYTDKSNPTLIETLLQCCFDVLGKHRTVQACLEHAELHLNIFEGMAGICVYDAMVRMERCLRNMNQFNLPQIEAHVDRCRHLATLARSERRDG